MAPRPDLKAWLKVRYWQLAQEKDAFVGTGLRDATGDSGDRLGTDIELAVHVDAEAVADPRDRLRPLVQGHVPGWPSPNPPPAAVRSRTDDSDYVYLSVSFRM